MSVKEIYLKTIKFVWMKLGLGLITLVASCILLALCSGIAFLFRSDFVFVMMVVLWIAGTGIIKTVIMHYFGYLVKAGHIAIVSEAVQNGQVPQDQFNVAKNMVQERFATSNVYFVVDKLVSGAVKQLQSGVDSVDNILGDIPGVSTILSFAKLFIGLALGYVDECCLGYTFIKKEDSAFKSAADGVVIYFQNWKRLLKNAAVMSLMVVGSVLLSAIIIFVVLGGLLTWMGLNGIISFIICIFIAIVIKNSFIDSYMMVKMMVSYLEVAPQTEITFNLYDKLSRLSGKFKELFNKGTENTRSDREAIGAN